FVGDGATLTTPASLVVDARDGTNVSVVAGAEASGNLLGVGLSGARVDVDRDVRAFIGDATVRALGVGGRTITGPGGTLIQLPGGVIVEARTSDDLLTYAAGRAGTGDLGLAASAVYNTADSETEAFINAGALVNADNTGAAADQRVDVSAHHTADVLSVSGSYADGSRVGLGAALDAQLLTKNVSARIGQDAVVNAADDVLVDALSRDGLASTAGGVAGAGQVSIAGSVSFIKPDTRTRAFIAGTVDAGGNVIVTADGDSTITADSGTASFGTTAGVAASVAALVKNDETEAFLTGTADVKARGNGATTTVKTGQRDVPGNEITRSVLGLWVGATSEEIISTTAAGGQNSGAAGAAGSLIFSVLNETTRAFIDPGARVNVSLLSAGGLPLDQSVRVWAVSRTVMTDEAGADVAGNLLGVGTGVDFVALTKETEARIGGQIEANRDVEAQAFSEEDLKSRTGTTGLAFVTAFGGAGDMHGLEITTRASVADGAIVRANGSVLVAADSSTEVDVITGDRNASTGAAGGASASAVV
ncbi:MAG: hypothetical protein L0227_11110, partial [Chloroflexi bacterium]|nr:hypothetical protein [Chloroflexota bacterium]